MSAERTFTIHEDDRKSCAEGCVSWASPKYLEYSANVRGFLDTDTLKLNAVAAFEEEPARYEYSRDFKWAAASAKGDTRFGRIVMR